MQPNTDSLSSTSGVRKRLLPKEGVNPAALAGEIDIASHAVLAYTSDDPDHPIENLITFSPAGATFQREEQRLNLPPITHLRLTIVPDKHGSRPAKLNSLRLFASESRSDP